MLDTNTINKIKTRLDNKLNEWICTITDKHTRNLMIENAVVLGGAIASLIQKEEPKDYDVFLKSKEAVNAAFNYYQNEGSAYITGNAISLNNKIQIVTSKHGSISEIQDTFDFLHCFCSYDKSKSELIMPDNSLECIVNKTLKYVGTKFPVKAMIRISKFVQRGYTMEIEEYLKIACQISKLDMSNKETFIEQADGLYYTDADYVTDTYNSIYKDVF